MSRGINIGKIIKGTRKNRDWENLPIEKINQTAKKMGYPIGLVASEKKVLVTIYLNKFTIDFFKKEANRYHTKYQRMMRTVLDLYANAHR